MRRARTRRSRSGRAVPPAARRPARGRASRNRSAGLVPGPGRGAASRCDRPAARCLLRRGWLSVGTGRVALIHRPSAPTPDQCARRAVLLAGRDGASVNHVGTRRRRALLALAVSVAITGSSASVAMAKTGDDLGPGCDRSRPAVAHLAGGVRVQGHRGSAPIPCMTFVGTTSESAAVGVGRSGSVFYAPLLENNSPPPQNTVQGPEWVVRSRDLGTTWTKLGSGGPTTGGLVPPWMSIDPRTSRIWFVTTQPRLCGARVSWSDDDGDQWRTGAGVPCPSQGGEKLIEGPA